MPSRDTEISAFVDGRGPALMRTASLLVFDDAEPLLVSALARTSRRWREASRDDGPEREVRAELYAQVLAHWRKTGGLDAADALAPDADEAPARRALRTLTRRERAVVVLRGFEGLDAAEVASLLRMRPGEAEGLSTSTMRRLTEVQGQPLGEIFREASTSGVPAGLVDEVRTASRSQGRRTWIAAAAVAVVALVGVFAVHGGEPTEPPRTNPGAGRWGIPADLPPARGLPYLGAQPVAAASAAYVVDGVPVVVDADTGAAFRVFKQRPRSAPFDYDVQSRESPLYAPSGAWTDIALSPDGTRLLLGQLPGRATARTASRVFLVELAGQSSRLLSGVALTGAAGLPGGAPRLAWAPDSESFACACRGRLGIVTADATSVTVDLGGWSSGGVAWGSVGVATKEDDRAWALIDAGGVLRLDTLSFADVLAMSTSRPPQYLTARSTGSKSLPGDTPSDGSRCVLWDDGMTNPVPVTPVPVRDGALCSPLSMQPGRSAFVLAVFPRGPTAANSGPDVVVVAPDGSSEPVAVLPVGTTAASFAASLVG